MKGMTTRLVVNDRQLANGLSSLGLSSLTMEMAKLNYMKKGIWVKNVYLYFRHKKKNSKVG